MRGVATVLAFFSLVATTFAMATPVSAEGCQFNFGFAIIQSMIPSTVGACRSDEQHAANGDGLQQTTGPSGTGGLLVWRKLDNWTAFTDGYHTWINGPNGLRERLNSERFCWEGDATGADCLSPSAASNASSSSVSSSSSSSITSTSSSSGSSSRVVVSSVQSGSTGGTARVTIHAAPNTPCSITYKAPDGTVSVMQGISPTATDTNGNATWSWGNGTGTYPGPGTVTITCGGATATTSLPGGP